MKRQGAILRMLALVLSLTSVSKAAPLDDRIPKESIGYFGWAGADSLAGQYDQSNLKSIIEASSIRAFINKQLPKLIDMASERDPNAAAQIDKLQAGLNIAWHHPMAIYFCPLKMTNPRKPTLRMGVICDAGNDAAKLNDLLAEALANVPADPDVPVSVSKEGSLVILSLGTPETLATLQAGGGIAGSDAYKKAMTQVQQPGQAIAFYIDMQGAMTMVDNIMASIPDLPPQAKRKATAVIDAMGVRGITQVAFLSGFNAKGWSEKAFVGITGPKRGILALMDEQPLSDAILAAVPKDAAAFSASKLDLAKVLEQVRTVVGSADDRAAMELERALAQGGEALGLDIEKDLINAIGNEWLLYRAPLTDGMSTVFINKLRDGDRFAKALDTLEKLFNERSGAPMKIEKITAGKTEVSALMFLQYNVAWTVHNGYLYVSTISGISGAMKQVDDKLPGITESDLYKGVMARMPKGIKPTTVGYAHPACLYGEIRTLVLGVLPLIRRQGIDIPMDLLPDPSSVSEFMTPGGGVTWSDADGLHGYSDSAFPGAQLFGGQNIGTGGVAVAAVGSAFMLPSLGRAREMANRTADASNLKNISMACMMYANDNNNRMPDHLARLVINGSLPPRVLVSKRSGHAPLAMSDPEIQQAATADFTKFSQQVDEHCDFAYTVRAMKLEVDAAAVIAYEKPGRWSSDGINVAFADGHVEFVHWNGVPETFTQSNDSLAKRGIPPVDIAALMNAAGRTAPPTLGQRTRAPGHDNLP